MYNFVYFFRMYCFCDYTNNVMKMLLSGIEVCHHALKIFSLGFGILGLRQPVDVFG